jgi:hypothetical protein
VDENKNNMAENKIELKSIGDLLGMNFFIPAYQRGYRWTEQQVKDLLDDVQEFIEKQSQGFYCIQPLVVKKSLFQSDTGSFKSKLNEIKENENILQATEKLLADFTKWEVIDGQQRLTTIYILLSFLNSSENYSLEYETREDSKTFLGNIEESKRDENIDYHHIVNANEQIRGWFIGKDDKKDDFLKNLLQNVKFIWYESTEEDPIKVFTRLNIGKISLTNAELIKALFLNKSNFKDGDYQKIRLQQQEIANEWDAIEYTLQNDEFWLFLHKADYDKPTRIDFIFDLICEKNILNLKENDLGTDEYKTFRYFYIWFKQQANDVKIIDCWKEVKTLFQTFQEWFNDLKLYHYVGYLLSDVNKQPISKITISELIKKWTEDKTKTKESFIKKIQAEIAGTLNQCKDLDKQYEKGSLKTQCCPILFLHNIQTIINQNKSIKENEKYKLPVFYKFPFHLFKKENWDVEHIDSNTENDLNSEEHKKQWLEYARDYVLGKNQTQIAEYLKAGKDDEKPDFETLQKDIFGELEEKIESKLKLSQDEKNQLWNFVLLDAGTNRGYGNAIFPAKRRTIINKDRSGTFIPPITKNVFSKYYNTKPNNLLIWDKEDAKAYLKNIKDVLIEFLS